MKPQPRAVTTVKRDVNEDSEGQKPQKRPQAISGKKDKEISGGKIAKEISDYFLNKIKPKDNGNLEVPHTPDHTGQSELMERWDAISPV